MTQEQLRSLTDPKQYLGRWVKELDTKLIIFVTDVKDDRLIGYGLNRIAEPRHDNHEWYIDNLEEARKRLVSANEKDIENALDILNNG